MLCSWRIDYLVHRKKCFARSQKRVWKGTWSGNVWSAILRRKTMEARHYPQFSGHMSLGVKPGLWQQSPTTLLQLCLICCPKTSCLLQPSLTFFSFPSSSIVTFHSSFFIGLPASFPFSIVYSLLHRHHDLLGAVLIWSTNLLSPSGCFYC